MRSLRLALVLCTAALAMPAFANDTTALPAIGPPEAAAEVASIIALPTGATADTSAFKFTVSLVIPAHPRPSRFKSPYIFDAIVVLYPEWAYFGSIWKKASFSPSDASDAKLHTVTAT